MLIQQSCLVSSLSSASYAKFNGAGIDYDGFGRNAKDNNSQYLRGWFLF